MRSRLPPRRIDSPRFVIVFTLALLAVSAAVFLIFSYSQRSMAAGRREKSAKNLAAIHAALRDSAERNGGAFPDSIQTLKNEFKVDPKFLIHPSWPDQAGYVCVSGARLSDPPDATILAFENVPERKRKLGRLALFLNGTVALITEGEFELKSARQEAAWKAQGRGWRLIELER